MREEQRKAWDSKLSNVNGLRRILAAREMQYTLPATVAQQVFILFHIST
jgi:hypothetical protein